MGARVVRTGLDSGMGDGGCTSSQGGGVEQTGESSGIAVEGWDLTWMSSSKSSSKESDESSGVELCMGNDVLLNVTSREITILPEVEHHSLYALAPDSYPTWMSGMAEASSLRLWDLGT